MAVLMASDNLRAPAGGVGHALGGGGGSGGAASEAEMRAKRAAFLQRVGSVEAHEGVPSGGDITDLAASLRQRQQQ